MIMKVLMNVILQQQKKTLFPDFSWITCFNSIPSVLRWIHCQDQDIDVKLKEDYSTVKICGFLETDLSCQRETTHFEITVQVLSLMPIVLFYNLSDALINIHIARWSLILHSFFVITIMDFSSQSH